MIDREHHKAPIRLETVFGLCGGINLYDRKITIKVTSNGTKRLITGTRVWNKA
jgi:CO dehydrogenase/acetyl-CoA synthase beta subunit